MTEPETFYALRRTDGDLIGDYGWVSADGPDDWTIAEEDADYPGEDPIEYEIVRMVVEPIARRSFPEQSGEDEEDDDA